MPLTTVTPQMETGAIAFSAYQSTLQAMSASTWAKVQLQTEEFDTNSFFDSTTNYRFQPTVAGYYQISGAFTIATSVSQVITSIYKNGVEFKRGTNIANVAAASSYVSSLILLNGSTDYVELWGFTSVAQNSSNAQYSTYFQGILVRQA